MKLSSSVRSAVATAAAALTFSLASLASAQQLRIAVVDTQRALTETEEGLRVKATMAKLFKQRQDDLSKKEKDLKTERDNLEKQKTTLPQPELAKRVDKWQQDMAKFQQTAIQYEQELQKKEKELTGPILEKTLSVVRRLATKEGFDMVLDKQAAIYFRSDLDVTDRVITAYNTAGAEVAPAATAKPAAPPAPKPQ
jgi:outer membrane protein